jgi:phage terminase large subunit-like protein
VTSTTSEVTCPIPLEAIGELEALIGRSLEGWDRSPPKHQSPIPLVDGAYFDAPAVAKVIRVLRKLPHTKDRWAGTAFDPEPWQIVWIIGPVFGWKLPDGRRIIREVWIEIPRKNGKSSLVSRVLIVHLTADGQMGGEVYALATSTEQARQVFGEGQTVVRRAPALRGRVEVLTSVMRVPRSGSIFRVLSKIAEAVHGLNPSAAAVDEVHLHKKRDLIDAIETGTAARSEPVVWYITTAGTDDETTIYAEKHGYAISLADGAALNPAVWVVIWKAEDDADPFSEETWIQANPNYPISPTREYLIEKAEKAKVRPSFLPVFKRLHLNIRGGVTASSWAGAEAWPNAAGSVVAEKLKGKPVWLGLCASSSSDLSAIAILQRNPEGAGWWARWRWFLPEDTFEDLMRRTEGHAEAWERDGWLRLTDGNVTDVARHTEEIRQLVKEFDLREMGYDPNGAVGIISPLVNELDEKLVPLYASNPSSALLDWERMLMAGSGRDAEFAHGGDPIAAWQVTHLRVKESATKITRIDRRASTENVSGIAACEMALRRALLDVPKKAAVLGGVDF